MKTKHVLRTLVVLVALAVAILFRPSAAQAAGVNTFTFSDEGIVANAPADSYSIKNTADLSITADGTYTLTGSCAEGSVSVKKNLEVTLILEDLQLTSTTTAPLSVKAEADVTIHLSGDNVLTDNEPDPDDAEGACIKVSKASSSEDAQTLVTFCGDGNLTCYGNTKNGIKGGAQTMLVFNQTGTINVLGTTLSSQSYPSVPNNGIAADGSVIINQGTFAIYACNDGIKSDPDVGEINEGTTTDNVSAGAVLIYGGDIDITCDGDGIMADSLVSVYDGDIDIQTMAGFATEGTKYMTNNRTGSQYAFDPDTMSAKGIKVGGDRAEENGDEPIILITGGTIAVDAADDAIHSDGGVNLYGGTYRLYSGDDGVHAETTLSAGVSSSSMDRDPSVYVGQSYEGLEGAEVNIYNGRYEIHAKDDAINAAGGSGNGSGGGGGWAPWGPGGPGGNSSTYNIYVYGGSIYAVCNGDGLDSNGGLYLYGGDVIVCSMPNGDNSALDADGTRVIDGAMVFTAGAKGIDGEVKSSWFPNGQKYATSSGSFSKSQGLSITVGNTLVASAYLPQSASYIMYTAPGLSANPSIAKGSFTYCKMGSFTHTWDEGVVTTEPTETASGVKTFTCTKCGATETQTIPSLIAVDPCEHETAPEGFVAVFAGEGATFNVFYSKSSVEPDEVNAYYAIARNGDTGEVDASGDGQVNFQVVLADGYSISDIVIEGGYKNLKDISADTGIPNTYRVTKVTSDLTITVVTALCNHESVTADDIAWTWSNGSATASFHCDECDGDFTLAADVASVLTSADTITFTAVAKVGAREFTSTSTAAPYTATFAGDDGVESISVYYIQKSTVPDEVNAATAVARDSKSGQPVISGDGQINFLVTLKDGYVITDVTATEGSYKNIKGPEDTGSENLYRITKVTADMTISIATKFDREPGWYYDGTNWYYYNEDGTLRTSSWIWANGGYYYLGADGKLVTNGWVEYQGKLYFLGEDGRVMKSSWLHLGDDWYYLGSDGAAYVDQWLSYKGGYYYFGADGKAVSNGWAQYNGAWYYLGADGKVVTSSWVQYEGAWYYIGANGRVTVSSWVKSGNAYYYVGADGKAVSNGWAQYNGAWYYLGADGKVVTSSWVQYEGAWYYIGANGRVTVSSWVKSGNAYYYVGADGKAVTSDWVNYKGSWYYLNESGNPLVSTSITLDGVRYDFDAQGRCTGSQPVAVPSGSEIEAAD